MSCSPVTARYSPPRTLSPPADSSSRCSSSHWCLLPLVFLPLVLLPLVLLPLVLPLLLLPLVLPPARRHLTPLISEAPLLIPSPHCPCGTFLLPSSLFSFIYHRSYLFVILQLLIFMVLLLILLISFFFLFSLFFLLKLCYLCLLSLTLYFLFFYSITLHFCSILQHFLLLNTEILSTSTFNSKHLCSSFLKFRYLLREKPLSYIYISSSAACNSIIAVN